MSEETPDTPDVPRYVIVGGGEPTPEELAALTVALTPVTVVADPAEAGDVVDPAYAGLPPWLRAALQENLGRRPFVSADDLLMAPPLFS